MSKFLKGYSWSYIKHQDMETYCRRTRGFELLNMPPNTRVSGCALWSPTCFGAVGDLHSGVGVPQLLHDPTPIESGADLGWGPGCRLGFISAHRGCIGIGV